MQLTINNWATTLEAPAASAALDMTVAAPAAARLGVIGPGDYYAATLARVTSGVESAWEVVHITANSGGVLTVERAKEGTTALDWQAGESISIRVTSGLIDELRTTGSAVWGGIGGTLADQADLQAALASKATSAQGALADTAVQPPALATALAGKVDKDGAKVLSDENYTSAEKSKLAGLESSHFKGLYASLGALQAAHPAANAGDYADVDAGVGSSTIRHVWDVSDAQWQPAGSGAPITAADVKTLYEANPDTNAYTDTEKTKLGTVASNATANPDTDSLTEGSVNKWFTVARVLAAVLSGLSVVTGGSVVDTDTVLQAIGKLQKQITDLTSAVSGKQDTLVSATNIKTINGASVLGSGDLAVSAGASLPVVQALSSSRALTLADANTFNENSTTDAYTVTIPAQVDVAWDDDTEIHFLRSGEGAINITAAAGVSINGVVAASVTMNVQHGAATLKRVGVDAWWLGGLVASAAEQRAALDVASKSGDTYTGQHDYGNTGSIRFAGTTSTGVLAAASSSGGLKLSVAGIEPSPLFIDFDASVPDAASTVSVRFFRSLVTAGACTFVFHKGNGTTDTQHTLDGKGAVRLNRIDGETVIGSATSNNVDRLQVAGSISATGAIKLASFTLATLPAAAANARGQVYCSNLTGQAAPVYSDGTNWRRVADNTIAN